MRHTLAILLTAFVLIGCEIKDPDDEVQGPSTDQGGVAWAAEGWDNVVLQDVVGLNVVVKLKNTGHWDINKRACGQTMPDFGILALEDWNRVVTLMNAVVAQGMGTEEYCVPITHKVKNPSGYSVYGMSGTATLKLSEDPRAGAPIVPPPPIDPAPTVTPSPSASSGPVPAPSSGPMFARDPDESVSEPRAIAPVVLFNMNIRPGEACTKLNNRQLAQDLANALNRVAALAAYNGCISQASIDPMP